MNRHSKNVLNDAVLVAVSIALAVILVKTGALERFVSSTQELRYIRSFVSGIFFVSIFTAAPAVVALGELAQINSIFAVAFFGACGSVVGDLIIFRFVRDRFAQDFLYLIRQSGLKKFTAIFRRKLFRWLIPFIGALIIASPLPDEIGVSMMGMSKLKMKVFIPISFTLNMVGILIVGIVARNL